MFHWSPGLTIAAAEKIMIQEALKWHGGNRAQTANALGISERTLSTRLGEYAEAEAKSNPVSAPVALNPNEENLRQTQEDYLKRQKKFHTDDTDINKKELGKPLKQIIADKKK